ncbi:hypothetical protein BGZ99_001662, partial [Dissophora globulifera]
MFAKSKNFIAPLALLLVACMAVDANRWCTCDGGSTPGSYCCTVAGGQYSGGNCLMGNEQKFLSACASSAGDGWPGTGYCWSA